MTKINYKRKVSRKLPVTKVNKVITPDAVYNREKEKKKLKKLLENLPNEIL